MTWLAICDVRFAFPFSRSASVVRLPSIDSEEVDAR